MLSAILTAGEYGFRVFQLFATLGFFWALCQISRECREIRAECAAEGVLIDPAEKCFNRLNDLHVRLFGAVGDDE